MRVYRLRMILLQVYALCFLLGYLGLAALYFETIQIDSRAFKALLAPSVFLAQLVAFSFIILAVHFI